MGFWRDQVVPRVVDRALAGPDVQEMRRRVCAGLQGDVVEVGFGSGLNVPHYPDPVTRVYAVDPSHVGARLARKRLTQSAVPVERAGLDGQRLDLPTESIDCALSTFSLCAIPDPSAALAELRRVLRTDGAFHFLEHGRAPDPRVARAQDLIQPVHGRLAAGCHITRDIAGLIGAAGFALEDLRTYYAKGPRPFTYVYEGIARKPA